MSTRCRIAYCFDEKSSIPSSYCHYDGYVMGVGVCLLDKYQNPHDAFYLASAGDFRGLMSNGRNEDGVYETLTVDQLEHYSKFPLPAINEDFDSLIHDFEQSDQEYLYVYFEKAQCWKVFENVWNWEEEKDEVKYMGDLESCVERAMKEEK